MFSAIISFVIAQPLASLGVGVGTVILGWIFKRITNSKIQKYVGGFTYGLGVTVTFGLSKWPWTRGIWNSIVEPFFIDLIDNVLVHGLKRFIDGMRSD